jgi:hypothetical protein
MGLTILSREIVNPEETLNKIVVCSLKMNLYFSLSEGALKQDGAIQYINIKKYFGNGEDDYELLLTDILSIQHSSESKEFGTFGKNDVFYYPLLATDNAPSKLSYHFSLAYLRLCPNHLISIYDWVFSLKDIEKLEQSVGWIETWCQDFQKLDNA